MSLLSREEFLADATVTAALDAYAESCLDLIEREEHSNGFPDPEEFLRRRGVEQMPSGSFKVHHKVQEIGAKPQQIECPDGSWGCRYVCRNIRGEQNCTYICNC